MQRLAMGMNVSQPQSPIGHWTNQCTPSNGFNPRTPQKQPNDLIDTITHPPKGCNDTWNEKPFRETKDIKNINFADLIEWTLFLGGDAFVQLRDPQSTLSVPKDTPKMLIFLTPIRPSGWSGLSYKASVLAQLSLAPEPHSNCEIASKTAIKDLSFLTKALVSWEYWQTLNFRPPDPGRRKPSIPLIAQALHANAQAVWDLIKNHQPRPAYTKLLYTVAIRVRNHRPKPSNSRIFNKKDLSTGLEAFSWSKDTKIPVSFVRSRKASVSLRNTK